MHKKSANPGRFYLRIEQGIFARFSLIAAEEGFAFTPSAATDNLTSYLGDVKGFIHDELSIDAEDVYQCAFDLWFSIITLAQIANRVRNKRGERRNILSAGIANIYNPIKLQF